MNPNTSTRWQKFLQSLKKREVTTPKKFGKTAATQPEALEGRIAPASLATLSSGSISVSGDQGGAGEIETLVFTVSGSDLHITDAGGITPGSGFTFVSANEVSIALTSLTADFTVNTGTGADAVTFSDALSLPGHATITTTGGSVTFGNTLTLAANKTLTANAGGTMSLPNATSDLATSGTGAISLTTTRDIQMGSGSSISTVNGNITLSANVAGSGVGFASGINLSGAAITSSGTGGIVLTGRGGSGADFIEGVGLNGSVMSVVNGNLQITGTGGTATGVYDSGVRNYDSQISSTGSGNIQIVGTAGTGTTEHYGISMGGAGSSVTSSGTGTITLQGTASAATIASGVQLGTFGTMAVTSSGSGALNLIGDSITIDTTNATVSGGANTVTVRQLTNGVGIDLGSTIGVSSTLNLSDAELDRVTASTLQIGNSSSGAMTVSAAISHANTNAITLTAGTGQNINLNANFTTAGGPLTFSNAVVLGASATVDTTNAGGTAAGAAVTFSGAINADAAVNTRNLTITAGTAGAVTLGGAVGVTARPDNLAITALSVNSLPALSLDGTLGITTTTGGITQSGLLTVVGATTLAVGSGNNITLNSANDFATLVVTSGNNVSLTDANAITLNASTVSGTFSVTASAGAITTGGAISSAGAITFTANDVTFGGGASSLSGGSTLLLRPNSDASSIGIGTGAAGTFNLDTTDLAALANGFTGITIGRSGTGSGSVDIRTSSFADDVSVHGGTITVTGLNAGTNNVALTSTVGPIQNGGDVVTDITGGVITLLKQGATRSADFYGIGGNPATDGWITVDATTVSATAQNGSIALRSAGTGGVSMSLAQANTFGTGNLYVQGATEDVTITSATAPGAATISATITGFNLSATGVSAGGGSVISLTTVTSGNITVGSAALSGGPISVTAAGDITVNGPLSSSTSTTLNGVNINGAGNIAATGGTTLTNTGTGTLSGVISGGALTKTGTGTVTLAGSNTYTGATTVNQGTLRVNGSVTSDVTVTSPGTFGGSGTVTGNVSGNGTVAPGNSPGILTISGNFTPTGTVAFEVNQPYTTAGTDYDQIVVGGTVDLSGATLSFTGGTAAASALQTLTLINKTSGGATVASASPAEGATVTLGSASFKIFYNGGDGNNVVLVDASTPTVVYAEDTAWSGFTNGTFIADADFGTAGNQPAVFGVNAFSTIGAGISAVTSSGQIIVNAGTYGEAVSLNGTKTLIVTSGAAVTTNSVAGIAGTTITINGTSLTTGDATSTTFSGVIGGAGALVKTGTGTLTLDGANTFGGGTTISQGTLIGINNTAFGTGAITLNDASTGANNTSILLANSVDISNAITVSNNGTGTSTIGTSGAGITNNATTFSGAITANKATTLSSTVTDRMDLAGAVGGAGALTFSGGGRTTLSNGGNTFTGGVSISGAGTILQLGVVTTANYIPDTNSVDVGAGSFFYLALGAAGTETISGLTGSGTVQIHPGVANSETLAVGSSNATSTFSGVIANGGGTLALTKVGTGTLTLTGANTYTGGTTVTTGTLNATVTTTQSGISTGAASITGGATLLLNNTNTSGTTVTVGNTFTGAGKLQLNFAAGTNARNTTMNNVTGLTGTIQLSNSGSTGDKWSIGGVTTAAALQIDSGSQLYATGTNSISGGINVQGTGNSETRGAIRLGGTLGGNVTLAADTTIGSEGGTLSGSITSGAAGTQTLTIGTVNSTGNATLTGVVGGGTGTIAVVKNAAGVLVFSNANTFSGGLTINAGTAAISAAAGAGTAGGNVAGFGTGTVTVNSGATAWIHGSTTSFGTVANAWTLNGGTLHIEDGATTFSGTVNVSAASTIQGRWGDVETFSNVISGAGALTFQRSASGTTEIPVFVLNGANTLSGAITVGANSIVRLGNATALGTTAAGTTVNSGGVLDLNGQAVGAEALTINGTGISSGGVLINSSGTAASFAGNVTLGSNSSIGGTGSFTLSGVVSGAFSLTKIGAGTVTLSSGSNTYSGGTSIDAGAITTGGLGLGGGLVTVAATGTLNAGGVSGLASLYYDLVQPGVANASMNTLDGWMGYLSPNSVNFVTNAPTMNLATALPNNPAGRNYGAIGTEDFAVLYTGILNVTTAGTYTFNTTSDDGSMLFIDGVAVVSNNFLQGPTTRTGSTTLTAGAHTIAIGFNERGGGQHIQAQISGPGNVIMEDIDSSMANGLSVTSDLVVHSIAGSGNVNLQGGSVILGATNATNTFTGPIASSGVGATVAGVTKFGTGTLTLGGNNTFAGRTFIGSGTLIAGTGTALGSVAGGTVVFAGGVLDLNGQTIGAEPLTLNSTGIAAGGALINSSGTAASLAGNVTLGSDSSIGGSGNFTLSGIVSGGFALTKVGANTISLNGANTYTGLTTISTGTLQLGNATALGTTAGATTIATGATLDLNGQTIAENITTAGTGVGALGAIINSNAAAATVSGTISNSGSTVGVAAGSITFSGSVNSNTLTKIGTGTLILSGSTDNVSLILNAQAGTVNLDKVVGAGVRAVAGIADIASGATVRLTGANTDQIYGGAGSGPNSLVNISAGGTLDLNGKSESISRLTGAGAVTSGVVGAASLTVGETDGTGAVFAGTILNGSGTVSLTKIGTGTQTISGTGSSTNTASGLLQVSGGTLIMGAGFAGDGGWQGDVTINNTATLQLAQGDIFNNGSDFTVNTGGTFNMASFGDAIGNIAGGGAITNNNGGLFLDDISGTKTFTGTINGTGAVTLRGNVAATGTQEFKPVTATTSTVSNLVVQRGTLVLGGAGTITASGNLSVGQVGAAGGNLTVQDTVTVGVGGEFLIGDASTIPGFVTQTGGTVNVGNRVRLGHWPSPTTSTYAMSGGTLNVTNALNVGWDGSATFTQTGGTVSANAVVIDGSGATATAVETYTLQGGTLNVGTGGITSVDGAAGYALNLGGGTSPVLRATGNFTSGLNATLSGSGASAITIDTNGFTVGLSGVLSGTGALTKIGANVLTLSGANTFSGATAINVGTLTAGNGSALGTAAGTTTVASGATLNINGQNLGAEVVNIAGTGVGGLGALVNNGADQGQALRFINLTADATVGGTNRFDIRANGGGEQLDLAGFTLTKVGAAQFSIVGTTVTNGNLTANAGTLAIETSSTVAGTGTITINSATLGLYANTGTFTRPIVLNSGAVINEPGSGATATVSSPITLNADVAINSAANTTIVLNGVITDGASTFGYTKGGAGTLVLAGANTYDGTTTVSAGTLQIGNGGTSGSVGTGAVINNSNLHFKRTDATSFGNTVTGTGTTRQLDGSGQVTITGSVTQANVYAGSGSTAGIATANPLVLSGTSVLNVSGVFGGSTADGGMGLFGKAVIQSGATLNTANLWLGEQTGRTGEIQQDGGAVTVSQQMRVGHWPSNTSTYTINGGTLSLTGTPAGGTEQNGILYVGIDGTGIFNQTGGTVTAAGMVLDNRVDTAGTDTYTMTGGTLVLGSFGISGNASTQVNLQGGTVRASASFTASLPVTFTGGSTTVDTNGFDITLNNTLSGSGNFNKINGGTLNISGTSAGYTGTGSMAAGTTNLTGTLGTSASFTVNGGTLIGTGTVGTLNVNTGGTVNPGTVGTVGTLNTATLNFNGGTYGADLIGTAADKITATTAVNVNAGTAGIFVLNNAASGVAANTVFTFIDNTSAGAISNPSLTNAAEGGTVTVDSQTARYTYLGGSGGNDFMLTVDGSLTVVGTAGADNFEVRRIVVGPADNIQVLRGGVVIDSRPTASYGGGATLTINAGGNNDNLFVNYGASGGIYNFDINYNGEGDAGAPGDSVTIGGASVTTVTHNFINNNDGNIVVLDGAGTRTVNYTGLEPIVDNLDAVNRVFVFSGVTETISLTDAGAGTMTIDSNVGGESVTFANPTTSLTINSGAGDDTINLTSMSATYAGSLTVSGDGDTDSITISAGFPTLSSATFTAETINAATLTTGGDQTYNGPVLLAAATTLTSSTGNITITGTTNGAQTLSLSAAAGNISLGSAVGGVTPLTSLTTLSATISALPAVTTGALSITATAGGVSGVNDIIVSGATSVTAAGAITLNGAANNFQGTVSLSATAAGAITVTDSTGGLNIATATTTDGAISLTATSGNLTATSVTAGGAGRNVSLTTATSGDVLVDNVTAAGDTITINSVGAIEESGADAGADITANSLSLTAATGIGAAGIIETAVSIITGSTVTGGIDLANTGALSITSLAASTSGNITLTNTGSIALAGNVSAASGNVSLTSTGNITRSAGTVSGTTVTFTATAGSIGGSGAEVNTSATSLIVASGGNQFIIEANGANVTSTATAGNITLTTTTGDWTINSTGVDASGTVNLTASAGDILRSGVAADITGTTLTLTAGGADGDLGASGNALLTGGTSIVFTGTGTGDVFITEADGANVTGSTGSGNITLTSTTGNWTLTSTGVDTTGNVTMNASAGDILRSGAAADITGNTVSLNAGGADGDLGASGTELLTSATQINFLGAGTGDVFITESNGASVSGSTTSGNVSLTTTTGDWNVNLTGINTTGNVSVTASAGDVQRTGIFANIAANTVTLIAGGADGDIGVGGTSPMITTATTVVFAGSGTGDVLITESNGASFSGTTGSGNITLLSTTGTLAVGGNITTTGDVLIQATAGAITRTAGTVSGDDLTLTAGLGIGASGAAVQTSVATIVTTSTADQFINEANGVAANLLNAGAANITLTLTAGALTDNNAAAINFSATNLTLVAPAGITDIETTVTTLAASTTNSDISITETNNVALNLVDAGTGDVFLTSGGSITDNNAAASNVNADALTISAVTGIDIDTTVTTVAAADVTGTGDLRIDDLAGGLNVTTASTFNGTLTITATGGNLVVTNADSSATLALQTITSGDIRVGSVAAGTTATLTSAARIDELSTPDGGVDITAATLSMTAVSGIGTNSGGALETQVSSLNATTGTGGVFIDNIGVLNVTGISATTSGNIVLNNYGDDDGVTVTIVGDVTISGPVSTSGNVTIIAHEIDDDLDSPPPYTNNVTVTSTITGNVVTLRAGDDLTIDSTGVVTSTGLMTLYAGFGDLDSYGNVVLNGTINPGGGLNLTSFGDIVFGAPATVGQPVINAPGATVTLTSLGGSIYDDNDNDKPVTSPIASSFVIDVVASVLSLNAPSGYIGEDADTIETRVGTISANAGAGGVFAWNTVALNVAAITTAGTTGTSIDITSEGSMTINGPVTESDGDDVNFFAVGAAADLTLNGTVTGSGNMNFQAGDEVLLGGLAVINNTGNLTVSLDAGWPDYNSGLQNNPNADLVISSTLNLGAASLRLSAPRNVILNGGSADITTAGGLTVLADRDSSAVGTGGTFQQIGVDSTVQVSAVDIVAADIQLAGTIDAGTGDINVFASLPGSPIQIHNTASGGLNISLTDLLALRSVGGLISLGEVGHSGTVFIGGLGTVGVGLVDADYAINGGAIDFNGGIVLHDDRTLSLDTSSIGLITPSGTGITDVTIGGTAGTLKINATGDVTLNTRVTNLGESNINGDFVLNNTNTNLTVTDDVDATTVDISVGTGSLTVLLGTTVSSFNDASGFMTITADGIALDGNITGGGILTLRGNTVATTFGFGDGATGMLNLDLDEVGNIVDGFSKIVIGQTGQTGDIQFLSSVGGDVTFTDPVQIVGGTAEVTIEEGNLVGTSDASFDIDSGKLIFTGTAPGIVTEAQEIHITAAITLEAPTSIESTLGGGSATGPITQIGTIDGAFALNIDAGDSAVNLYGNSTTVLSGTSIGGSIPLASLTVNGGALTLWPNIVTTGDQDYTGTSIHIPQATRSSLTGSLFFNGPVTVDKPTNNFADVSIVFNGDVNSGAAGKGALFLKAPDVTFAASVGDLIPLASVTVESSGTLVVGASGTTFEANALAIKANEVNFDADSVAVPNGTLQIETLGIGTALRIGGAEGDLVSGAPTLNISDADIAALADGINSIIFGRLGGTQPIVVAEAGPVTFLDSVTLRQANVAGAQIQILGELIGDTANGNITTKSATLLAGNVTTLAGGNIDITNGIVSTDVTLDSSAGGGSIFIRGNWVAGVAGSDLTVSSGGGNINITGNVGTPYGKPPVLGLVTLDSDSNIIFGKTLTADSLVVTGSGIAKLGGSVLTTGADGQFYATAVQIAKATTITSKHADGAVIFDSTVDSQAPKFNSLSITNRVALPATTTVEFHSTIGATNRLGTFRINTTGVVELSGAAKAKAVSIRAAEFTVGDVDTAVVDTVTNAQTYYGVGNFLGSITSERLTVTSTADVTNVEPWRVSGVTTINTKTNADVTLLNIAASPKNVFGEVSIRGGNVVLEAEGNVNVRGMKAYNSISLNVSDILGLDGNITQTGAITAENFTATAFASITLDHTRNRIAQFTSVSAGNSLTLVSNKAGNVALDGVMHAGTGSVDLSARSGSFIYTATAEIDSALDWTMFTTVLKPTGYNLEAWFTTHGGPLSIEEGVFGVPPTAGGNVIVYRILGA